MEARGGDMNETAPVVSAAVSDFVEPMLATADFGRLPDSLRFADEYT